MDSISAGRITSYTWNNSWTVCSYELITYFVANKGIPQPPLLSPFFLSIPVTPIGSLPSRKNRHRSANAARLDADCSDQKDQSVCLDGSTVRPRDAALQRPTFSAPLRANPRWIISLAAQEYRCALVTLERGSGRLQVRRCPDFHCRLFPWKLSAVLASWRFGVSSALPFLLLRCIGSPLLAWSPFQTTFPSLVLISSWWGGRRSGEAGV